VRLFVALELPDHVRGTLERWRPRDGALRPVAEEQLHVTLAFLGERDAAQAAVVAELLPAVRRPVRALALGGVLALPPRRPRVLAVTVQDGDGALGALQADVATGLDAAIGWRSEHPRFLAHVTVARVRGRLAAPVPPSSPPPSGRFAATALTLFRSHTGAGGSRYERVETVPL
jgi:2'-5' RNA ligase